MMDRKHETQERTERKIFREKLLGEEGGGMQSTRNGRKDTKELAVVRGVDVEEELTPTRQQGENGRSDVTRSKSSACHSP